MKALIFFAFMMLLVLLFSVSQERDLRDDLQKCELKLESYNPKPTLDVCTDLIICTEPSRSF